MMQQHLIPLAKTTLQSPVDAATTLIGWDMPRDILWTALALVAAFNTFVITVMLQTSGSAMEIPSYFYSPLALFVLMAGIMVIYVHAIYWAGLAINGQGSLDHLLAAVVWLQALRSVAQLGVIILSFLVPAFGLLAMMVVALWGFWILLNFIATVLHLPSVGHGFAVLVIGLVGLVLGLSILLALIGVGAQGIS